MPDGWKPLYAWAIVVLLHAAQTIYYYPRLPMVVAQHFGANGQPNGWASRDFFFAFSWLLLLGLGAIFMFAPRLLRRLPVSMINLPNKQYWLAPERKGESLGFVERQLQWMAVLTLAFLVLVMHLVIHANLSSGRHLENPAFIILLIAYVVSVAWWILKLYRRFPTETPQSSSGMRK